MGAAGSAVSVVTVAGAVCVTAMGYLNQVGAVKI